MLLSIHCNVEVKAGWPQAMSSMVNFRQASTPVIERTLDVGPGCVHGPRARQRVDNAPHSALLPGSNQTHVLLVHRVSTQLRQAPVHEGVCRQILPLRCVTFRRPDARHIQQVNPGPSCMTCTLTHSMNPGHGTNRL